MGVPDSLVESWNRAVERAHESLIPLQDEAYEAGKAEMADENERLRTCLLLAKEVGEDWRSDWSDFDGRTLRDQMNDLPKVANGEMTPDEYREQWLSSDE